MTKKKRKVTDLTPKTPSTKARPLKALFSKITAKRGGRKGVK